MINPLSIYNYYRHNIGKSLIVVVVVGLSVFAMVAGSAILTFVVEANNQNGLFFEKYYTLDINDRETQNLSSEEILESLQKSQNIDEIITEFYQKDTKFQTPLGAISKHVNFLPAEKYKDFIDTVEWEITEGRLPAEGTNEITLTQSILDNKDWKVGDVVGSQVDSTEDLRGKYLIVGSFAKGTIDGGLGSYEYAKDIFIGGEVSVLLKPKKDRKSNLNEEIKLLSERERSIVYETEFSYQEYVEKNYEVYGQISWSVIAIVTLVIMLTVGLLQIIFFMQRTSEFGLLQAIGYSTNYVVTKSIYELAGIVLTGWFMSLILLQLTFFMLNDTVFVAKGLDPLKVLDINTLIFSLPVPISVFGFSISTILWNMLRFDPISIIERRN